MNGTKASEESTSKTETKKETAEGKDGEKSKTSETEEKVGIPHMHLLLKSGC